MHDKELPDLTSAERERYARHLVLPAMGERGQRKLKGARVLIVGLGGLGSPVALYLAASGVGCIGVVDDDLVGLSNLQRQIVHGTAANGRPKVESGRARLSDLNPDICIETYEERFDETSAKRIAETYDLIVDGTDSFPTRYVINRTCLALGIPYVYGAIFRFEGQVSLLCTKHGPCYQCLFPEPPPSDTVMSGAEAGILGAIPGTIGTLEATEAIKWIAGIGKSLIGRLLFYDGAAMHFEEIAVSRNPDCPACGSDRAFVDGTTR